MELQGFFDFISFACFILSRMAKWPEIDFGKTYPSTKELKDKTLLQEFLKPELEFTDWFVHYIFQPGEEQIMPKYKSPLAPQNWFMFKGHWISKWFLGSSISSKKRMNKFNFTTIIPQVDLFSFVLWRKLTTQKINSKLTYL